MARGREDGTLRCMTEYRKLRREKIPTRKKQKRRLIKKSPIDNEKRTL